MKNELSVLAGMIGVVSIGLFNSCIKKSTEENSPTTETKLTLVDNSTTGGSESLLGTSGTAVYHENVFFRVKMTNVSKDTKRLYLLDESDTLWISSDTSFAEGCIVPIVFRYDGKIGTRNLKFMINNGTKSPTEGLTYALTYAGSNQIESYSDYYFEADTISGTAQNCWCHSNLNSFACMYTYSQLKAVPQLMSYVDLLYNFTSAKRAKLFCPSFVLLSSTVNPYASLPMRRTTRFSGVPKLASDFDNATFASLEKLKENTNTYIYETAALSDGDVYLFRLEKNDRVGILKVISVNYMTKRTRISIKIQK